VTYPFASLPENLAAFCELLRRDYRFRVGPRELEDAARALELADLLDERTVRNVMRPVLAGTLADVQVFDRAFEQFFAGLVLPSALPETLPSAPTPAEQQRADAGDAPDDAHEAISAETGRDATDTGDGRASVLRIADEGDEMAAKLLRGSYSPFDAEGSAADLEPLDKEWREAAAALVRRTRAGLLRRWRPATHGQRFDFRRTVRGSLHTGGDLILLRWRARSLRKPRFVLLIDGSRSMSSHARPPLRMAVALTSVAHNTETFTFSTALMRVTTEVRRAAAGERRHLQLHHAWGGGTTIGACLDHFLQRFGERTLSRETVVIIASDGLDVGNVEVLRDAMSRLARRASAIVWLNPLIETPGYEPAALGMSAARPFVTTFAAVNDAAALARLAGSMISGGSSA
jgi:uncharacterized protein with von Willebrand factor type A (vWA) domain